MTAPTHNRHTIRLPGYDYAQPGAYFVTSVTHGRDCALGSVVDGNVILSSQGIIVQKLWQDLPKHFQLVMLDEFVIVPNHIHGILMIMDDDRTKPGVMEDHCRGEASGNGVTREPARNLPDASPLQSISITPGIVPLSSMIMRIPWMWLGMITNSSSITC